MIKALNKSLSNNKKEVILISQWYQFINKDRSQESHSNIKERKVRITVNINLMQVVRFSMVNKKLVQ